MKTSVGVKRPVYDRIRRIHELVSSKKSWTAALLATELEVSEGTARRDIGFMRDRLGFPLMYEPKLFKWSYMGDFRCPFCGKKHKKQIL